jgi:hypothetical protein
LYGCEKKGVAGKGIYKIVKTKGERKGAMSREWASRAYPTRVFLMKSAEVVDSIGVEIFDSDKEFVTVW